MRTEFSWAQLSVGPQHSTVKYPTSAFGITSRSSWDNVSNYSDSAFPNYPFIPEFGDQRATLAYIDCLGLLQWNVLVEIPVKSDRWLFNQFCQSCSCFCQGLATATSTLNSTFISESVDLSNEAEGKENVEVDNKKSFYGDQVSISKLWTSITILHQFSTWFISILVR